MTIKINELINDIKLFVDTYEREDCNLCRDENGDQPDESDCAECLETTTLSERVRMRNIFGTIYTNESWIEYAFSDHGANLSPSWYDFDPEKISDEQREQVERAMENYLK